MAYNSRGQYDKAIEYYQQALTIDRKLGTEGKTAIVLNNIGSVYQSLGQYDKAIEHYKESIKIREKLRLTAKGDARRDYLASVISTYEILTEAYFNNQQYDQALASGELSRTKGLAEQMTGDVK
ncbi:MAG: tetratricopeptide repeat protein [Methylococcales bacterium]|jgi:tetratricopeptide (TPR) repeat protein|nr:tetratricopeptide repeat protein [Methylococcales bacterium]MBT7409084.1 tetratricopeptide repeat protein [Methylococcales bacterium]